MLRFHLLFNAHLDRVWLWNSRGGLNGEIATYRAMLGLMNGFPKAALHRTFAARVVTFAGEVLSK